MNSKSPRAKLRRAVEWLLGSKPWYASILCNWKIEADTEVTETMATDGAHLYYNPEFVDSLTQQQCSWCLLHEVGHIFLGHHIVPSDALARWLGSDEPAPDTWNESADLALNSLIANEPGCPDMVYMPGRSKHAKLPAGKSVVWYYRQLDEGRRKQQEERPGEQGEGKGSGNQPGDQDGAGQEGMRMLDRLKAAIDRLHPPSQWGEVLPAKDQETAKAEWQQRVAEGLALCEGKGDVPGWVKELAGRLLAPPVPDTKQLMRQFFSRTIRQGNTYSVPNRRRSHLDGIILPARRSRSLGDVALIIDTSGSMNIEECNTALRWMEETLAAFRGAKVTAIQCDQRVIEEATKTYTAYDFPINPKDVVWHGRGGTDMAPAIVAATKLHPACIVMVSDMEWCCDHAPDPGIPMLWIVTSGGRKAHRKPKYGTMVMVQ